MNPPQYTIPAHLIGPFLPVVAALEVVGVPYHIGGSVASSTWGLPRSTLVRLASPEDTILHKLRWYHMGGGVSERQWLDVLGVLKTQNTALERAYLQHWAVQLGVADLLDRAWEEAGLAK